MAEIITFSKLGCELRQETTNERDWLINRGNYLAGECNHLKRRQKILFGMLITITINWLMCLGVLGWVLWGK